MGEFHGCRDLVADRSDAAVASGHRIASLWNGTHIDRRLFRLPGGEGTTERHLVLCWGLDSLLSRSLIPE
jgi:hypothetical protein